MYRKRFNYKGRMGKTSWGGIRGGKWGWLAWRGLVVVNGDNCTSTTIKKKIYNFGIRLICINIEENCDNFEKIKEMETL